MANLELNKVNLEFGYNGWFRCDFCLESTRGKRGVKGRQIYKTFSHLERIGIFKEEAVTTENFAVICEDCIRQLAKLIK